MEEFSDTSKDINNVSDKDSWKDCKLVEYLESHGNFFIAGDKISKKSTC
jgi:hypothetical protein